MKNLVTERASEVQHIKKAQDLFQIFCVFLDKLIDKNTLSRRQFKINLTRKIIERVFGDKVKHLEDREKAKFYALTIETVDTDTFSVHKSIISDSGKTFITLILEVPEKVYRAAMTKASNEDADVDNVKFFLQQMKEEFIHELRHVVDLLNMPEHNRKETSYVYDEREFGARISQFVTTNPAFLFFDKGKIVADYKRLIEFTKKFTDLFTQKSDSTQIKKVAAKRFWQLLNQLPQEMSEFSESDNILDYLELLLRNSHRSGGKGAIMDWFVNVFLLLSDENQTWVLDQLTEIDKTLYGRFIRLTGFAS